MKDERDPPLSAGDGPRHFIQQIIEADLAAGRNGGRVVTRFPPEPNGYLHIGHAKSICLNFGLALDYGGRCHMRFDDTNPQRDYQAFVDAILEDVRWLGYDWGDHLYFASDYFGTLYELARELIGKGLAYVCDLDAEAVRDWRGTLTEPGRNSPWRERSIEENLELFARMRAGDFPDGERVLRAKIDMASPNMNLRDPTLYRIRRDVHHHRTGDQWCIYPTYDYAHPISDALERVTHSLCTLEFEDHRPLYDWVLANVSVPCRPQQIEFARLNLQYTVMSKRRLTRLVEGDIVDGWDDPRLPTIAGLRRRGYTPGAIREFCARIGISRADNMVEMGLLESCIRDELNRAAPRRMAVLDPLRIVLEDWPEGEIQWLEVPNHPQDPAMGVRRIPFGGELWIDQSDFSEDPPRGFRRLTPGGEVRLRYGYVIRCEAIERDADGRVTGLRCRHDPATLGAEPEGRRVRGVIHWVSAAHAIKAEVRLYDQLFTHPTPDATGDPDTDFLDLVNPASVTMRPTSRLEPALEGVGAGERFQFEREGYFTADPSGTVQRPVFNRIVTLRDSWSARKR